MSKKLNEQLKKAFEAPSPTGKNEFLTNLPYPKASVFGILICQMGYIRKRFWCLSILGMIGLLVILVSMEFGYEKVSLISSIMPLFTILGVSEIGKSAAYNMDELEMSCKYNLQKVTLLRLCAIGSFYFGIFLILSLTFNNQLQLGILRSILYGITPFLLSSYLAIWVINHLKNKEVVYVCTGVTVFVSIFVYMLTINWLGVYASTYTLLWSILFIVLSGLLYQEIRNLMKQTEELQCHSLLID
ncbi:MAG: hypothetical protein RR776_12480 [Niameybacter sp.]|uniref:hypothetical protein n=1 Tax=Niameybacter sp. TaxID=2033640 RepID=UPI002FC65A3B